MVFIDGNALKIVKKKITSEKSDIDLNNSAFRDALQAIESAPNIRDPTCVNFLCGIDGIQYLDDGHWQLLRNKLCGKLSRLDRRLWSGNGSNICGNKIVTSWRGACSNRGATNKSSNVSKNKVETTKCDCKATFSLKRTGAICFKNDHLKKLNILGEYEDICKEITTEELHR